jgi:hypothetical protein
MRGHEIKLITFQKYLTIIRHELVNRRVIHNEMKTERHKMKYL